MEWFRWQQNPWGQNILRGMDWDVTWLAVVAAGLFMVIHIVMYLWRWRRMAAPAVSEAALADPSIPERVLRHSLTSRLFHWSMAASMFVLLVTGFLPIIGVNFSWVTPHWIAGLVLTGAILFHIVHATFWKGLRWMWITLDDCRQGWLTLRQAVGLGGVEPDKPGKNPLENKLFHHVTSVATIATIATGLLMMVRVDTPFWTRNPYLLPDSTWGVMFVVHGAASIALIALIMVHIYFAVRPEKRWITWSMIRGWISRRQYLTHYDPARWPLTDSERRSEVRQ
ncbi:MAG: hypothetical protein ETSY1_03015 [Candidatus Entotheonella factor]|uniref:Cytochrome b561 bacterial/Ni-hydrogenase domain-containing protein n=1 Tax=Entotheonella factor TaxID=1429438 RepID=W4LXF0_ENTF1|nr:MAG: hypothetical protein ETSY1_03015 [Candidatus Entotheonella factor]